MNKILLALFTIILLNFLVVQGAQASLEANLISSSPFPAKPGDMVTLQFTLHNTGSQTITNVTTLLEPEDDLFLVSESVQVFPQLQADETKTVMYRVGVSGSGSGTQQLRLRFGALEITPDSQDFEISVSTSRDTLVINKVSATPSQFAPGSSGEVTILIENTGEEKVKDVSVKLDLSGNTPFVPKESSSERRIDSIRKGNAESITFKIQALPGAAENIYKVPVQISYRDEFGAAFTKADIISLSIASTPHLQISLDNSGFIEGKISKVSIKVVNIGLNNVRFVNLRILQGDYDIISIDQAYLGNIDSDDFQTSDFDLLFRGTSPVLRLEITYEGETQGSYQKQIDLPVAVYDINRAKELGLVSSSSVLYISLGVATVIILFFILRKIRKRRKSGV